MCSSHDTSSAYIVTSYTLLAESDGTMVELKNCLCKLGIEHTTIQFEYDNCGQGTVVCAADD